ncbi:hypothetical protein L2E82_39144 [Cichorium intybus]|uniref:Uncharacterized protein n=1 Tax=Cichorium intybus TaxID=13427 RepID=A0ACB9AJ45_CICIN|nr:hypothetical protein L2E82_39144 [Cichorium intybus]
MAQEHREEGNKLFQKKDYEGAMSIYEKALKLLPKNHINVSYLHTNIASCYMQMGITEFPKAIHECNLALEVTPKYSKALLKRARCYEALDRLDLALKDVTLVLNMEPKNIMAMEIAHRVKSLIESKNLMVNGEEKSEIKLEHIDENKDKIKENGTEDKLVVDEKGPKSLMVSEEKVKKLEHMDEKKDKFEVKETEDKLVVDEKSPKSLMVSEEKVKKLGHMDEKEDKFVEKETEDKLVVDEKIKEKKPKRSIKLVYGDDIRWAKIPFNCDVLELREIISERFPLSRAILIKYQDQEGDMVTITTNEELKWAESLSDQTSVKLHIIEVNPEQDPFFDHFRKQEKKKKLLNSKSCIDDWILEFAELFKNYVGFSSDSCLDLHEVGMKLYMEAMEDTLTSEESQELFNKAADKFQEMAALALFNCGNVYMSKARKRVFEKSIKDLYEWAQNEYTKAGEMYEEAVKIKPDFYEGFLALGHQEFEQAKVRWYYEIGNNDEIEKWDSSGVIGLYNKAEENMEKGMEMWEKGDKNEGGNMKSLIHVLWGTMLYERSSMEFKLGLPFWHECLEIAVEKFEVAGVSHTDIAVMIKNHCSNVDAPQGLGFDIDEIVQAWHEMYEVKRWQSGVPSFRLEPLLRRRVSKYFYALEHAHRSPFQDRIIM